MTEPSPSEPVAEDAALTDALYARPPGEFVARRDELAARARAGGDRALAARIKALRRPSVGAWYLNTAVRAGTGSLPALLALGEALREAQASGDVARLRDLAARRGPLTGDVVRDLGALMRALGATTTPAGLDEVRATLAAALADPAIAAEVASGRLDGPRTYSGFGDLLVAFPPASPSARTESGTVPNSVHPDGRAAAGHRGAHSPDGVPQDAARAADAERAAEAEHTAEAERAAQAEHARRQDEARSELAAAEEALRALAARRSEAEADATAARVLVEELAARLAAARHELAVAEAELADAASDERVAGDRVAAAREQLSS